MSNLEVELEHLKQDLLEMTDLVKNQLEKSMIAVFSNDLDLANQVIANDKRINGLELKIDKDCENILALYAPVAIDLRFVLASLKINHDLERIGDHAEGIARYVADFGEKIEEEILAEFKIAEMYGKAITMLEDINEALQNDDTKLARKIFKKDDYLDKRNKKATKNAVKLIEQFPEKAKIIIPLLSIVRKIDRVGDLTKNLGEEIIFHIEAKVLKHKKKEKKKDDNQL
ncbi:MAG: phosphate signaling complex protein PhoU [Bacteroidota bacterium]|nr:phosphate signaling complex protein PhoU [Bacteroidota bacterium]